MKKISALLISVAVLFITVFPCFAFSTVTEFDAPYDVMYHIHSDGTNERIIIGCLLTEELSELISDPGNGITQSYGYIQADYRIDGGDWQHTPEWDTNPDACDYGLMLDKGATMATVDLMYLTNPTAVENAGALVKVRDSGEKVFDLENHSLEIRLRATVAYSSTGNYISHSDWTQTVKVERKEAPELPLEFEAPAVSNLQVVCTDEEAPYLTFDVKTPESMKKAQAMYRTYVPSGFQLKCYVDYGEGWVDTSMSSAGGYFSNETKILRFNNAVFDDRKNFKVKLSYLVYDSNDNALTSPESEVLKIQVPRWVEGKGVMHAKCTTCGVCRPVFGKCMFVVFGIAAVVFVIAAIIAKIQFDKARMRKAEAEAERQRKIEADKQRYNEIKQAKKEKNKKGNK